MMTHRACLAEYAKSFMICAKQEYRNASRAQIQMLMGLSRDQLSDLLGDEVRLHALLVGVLLEKCLILL